MPVLTATLPPLNSHTAVFPAASRQKTSALPLASKSPNVRGCHDPPTVGRTAIVRDVPFINQSVSCPVDALRQQISARPPPVRSPAPSGTQLLSLTCDRG